MKSLFAAGVVLLAIVCSARALPNWTSSEDETGQLNVIGRGEGGELRIVIKGPGVKVFALLKSLERGNAPSFEVSTAFGAKKTKGTWLASADPAQSGTILQAPNGPVLLADFLKSTGSTFSVLVKPPGKLNVIADYSLSGLEEHRGQIEAALAKPPVVVKPAPPPPKNPPPKP